jgi:hypothetical protein
MNHSHYPSWQVNSPLILKFCEAEAALLLPLLGDVVITPDNNQLTFFWRQLFKNMSSADITGMNNNIAGIHPLQDTGMYRPMGVGEDTDSRAIHGHPWMSANSA